MSHCCLLAEFNLFDVVFFQGASPDDIDLPRPNTVDREEGAFLTNVALSALQELGSREPLGAACAVASTKVSLSESEI